MINRRDFCITCAGAFFLRQIHFSKKDEEVFDARTFRGRAGETMPYRLWVPKNYDRRRKYPLVLWLHGSGGRGNDNLKQVREGNATGAFIWTKPGNQARHACLVVVPQCPEEKMWIKIRPVVEPTGQLRIVVELIRELQATYSIDAGRLYVAGQSMGGYGTWALISEHPNMFAAAVPICGGGDESKAQLLTKTPIWAFHGDLDRAVNVERSRTMISAIKRAGGTPRYTEYAGEGHVIWDKALNDPELLPWVFAQRR